MRLIYENEEVSFYLASCNNEQLVISFCPMNHNFNAKGIPGGNVFNKLGYDCLGVIPKRNNWYPRSYMVDGYSAVSKLLSKYKCIISYGSSMGGYGAIKYSKLFNCDFVISFSPQYSIEPQVVSAWENKYSQYFDSSLHSNMEISSLDLSGRIFIFYDEKLEPDKLHFLSINKLANVNTPICAIKANYCGHYTLIPIASSHHLRMLIQSIMSNEEISVRNVYNIAKKQSLYFKSSLLHEFSKRRLTQKKYKSAKRKVDKAIIINPTLVDYFLTKIKLHDSKNDIVGALESIDLALKINPNSNYLLDLRVKYKSRLSGLSNSDMHCNICLSTEFHDYNKRENEECIHCKALARHRIAYNLLFNNYMTFESKDFKLLQINPSYVCKNIFGDLFADKYRTIHLDKSNLESLTKGNYSNFEIVGEKFDCVFHMHFLDYTDADYKSLIIQLMRLVKVGGIMVFSVQGPNMKNKTKQVCISPSGLSKQRHYYFGIDFIRYLESLDNVDFVWDSLDNKKRHSMNVNENSNRFIILKKLNNIES